jgi:hypothetical protein
LARQEIFVPSASNIALFLKSAKPTDILRKALVRHVPFSGQLLEHSFLTVGLPPNAQVKDIGTDAEGVAKLSEAMNIADNLLKEINEKPSKGYITYKKLKQADGTESDIYEVSITIKSDYYFLGV